MIEGSPRSASPKARLAYARAHARLGRWDRALADYEKAIEGLPDDPRLRAERARCYQHLARDRKAEGDYATALALLDRAAAGRRRALDKAPADRERREAL